MGHSEDEFREAFTDVLDFREIEYETEKMLPREHNQQSAQRARIDVYIPSTDTAIEIKRYDGQIRGVGRALNYTRHHKEAILMLDAEAVRDKGTYRVDAHRTARVAPAVYIAYLMPSPNPGGSGADLDVLHDGRPDFFWKMKYGREWPDQMAVFKPITANGDSLNDASTQLGQQETLNAYIREDHSE